MGRINACFTADMVRDAVGHESEAVERGYFHATMQQRAAVLSALAAGVEAAGKQDLPLRYGASA